MCKTSVIKMKLLTLEVAEDLGSGVLSFSVLAVSQGVLAACGVYPGSDWVADVLRDGGFEPIDELETLWRKSQQMF